jgi:hypothetical protein
VGLFPHTKIEFETLGNPILNLSKCPNGGQAPFFSHNTITTMTALPKALVSREMLTQMPGLKRLVVAFCHPTLVVISLTLLPEILESLSESLLSKTVS